MKKHIIGVLVGAVCFFFAFKSQNIASAPFDEAKEKKAIMETIEQETACFYKRDYNCWKETYANADYVFQAWNNGDGTFDASVGWKNVDERVGKYIKDNQTPSTRPQAERKNMIVKFYGENVAYLIWNQYSLSLKTSRYGYSKETRLMEKQNGKWRIVSVSAFWDYKNTVSVDSLKYK